MCSSSFRINVRQGVKYVKRTRDSFCETWHTAQKFKAHCILESIKCIFV